MLLESKRNKLNSNFLPYSIPYLSLTRLRQQEKTAGVGLFSNMAAVPTQLVPPFLLHKPGRRAELSSSQKSHGRYFTRTCDSLRWRDRLTARGAIKRTLQIASATATDQEEKDRVLQTLVRGMDQVVLVLEDLDSIVSLPFPPSPSFHTQTSNCVETRHCKQSKSNCFGNRASTTVRSPLFHIATR